MRKYVLGFVALALGLHLVGCDGGGGASPPPEVKRTPEQQKEIDDMKANMTKGVTKHR